MRAFAAQASVAIKAAQDVAQMATWAAQLQSIQQLGTRLNRLTSVREIGMAIATELRQLLDYHNVRVYRVRGPELVPVAMLGRVGEYEDETPEMLSVRVGEGITGWVAQHGIAQYLPDAAHDARARTIPGTDSDLAESMLLAPMVFEDQVLGVVVLSKLGLGQFSDDDLRLLVIYASFAAQAMANADATEVSRAQSEALERQVLRQRELLELTESMLTILDPDALLEEVTRRLGVLVACDNVFVDLLDRSDGRLRPIRALGPDAEAFLADQEARGVGVAAWVAERNVPLLVADERDDPRVRHLESTGPHDGSLIVVPLRDRDGVSGVLTIERIAPGRPFSTDESELVQLFAAQVSIALQNATVHSAVEVRARTDALTGLLNHGAFEAWLTAAVAAGSPFSLIMVDLDDFKAANDALGHQTGDDVLRSAAAAITRSARSTDPVFRYGGDEFIVCLPGDVTAAAPAAAARIRRNVSAIGDEPPWRARGVRLGTSIGYASFPADGQTAAEILLAADRACYVAKRSGRGLIVTAATGRELAADSALQEPTPVDPPTAPPVGDATS